MIEIRRNHPIVKFAYLFQGQHPPRWFDYEKNEYRYDTTSLCPLFWRCVLNLIAVSAPTAIALFLAFQVGRKLIHLPMAVWREVLIGGASVLIGAAGIYGIATIAVKFSLGRKIARAAERTGDTFAAGADTISESIAWQMVKAVKSKMCPLVKFTEQTSERTS